jgi:hypothetical protein
MSLVRASPILPPVELRTWPALAAYLMSHAAPAGGYRPRSHTNALKEIVEDHLEEFLHVYDDRFRATYGPMHPRVRDLLEAYVR